MMATANELSPLQAYNLLMAFASRHGENVLRLALHASLPQVLRTDILHLLRLNFVPESMPELAVEADVLFAPFCQDLGNGYYRIDQNVRLQLLQNLDPAYAEEPTPRSVLIARFLLSYIEQKSRSGGMAQDRLYADYLEVERWGAFGFLDPEAAATQLAAALQQATSSGEIAVRIRVAGLATALSTPLARYGKLLTYAAGLEAMETGSFDQARQLLEGLGDAEIEIGKIRLKSPHRVLQERLPPVETIVEKKDRAVEPPVSKTTRNTVFICYNHRDKKWLDQLLTFLKPLELGAGVELWDDTRIKPGSNWWEEIRQALAATKVAVFLVSTYFLASDYIAKHELQPLLKAAEQEGIVILPVILDHCVFEKTELSRFQVINDPHRPLDTLSRKERDKTLRRIARVIGKNFDFATESEFEDGLESRIASELKKGIYLSYRRDDDTAYITKLADELHHYFGEDSLWMADQKMQSGPAFDAWLRRTIKQTSVMLVVMGPRWLSPTSSEWVHVNAEVKAALESNIFLIPVLVGGAHFPLIHLPHELEHLKMIHEAILDDATWSQDFRSLIDPLKQKLRETALKDKTQKDKSAFVPGYQRGDIFVSYAHVDDMVYPDIDAAGWVATLIAGLNVKLSQKLGRSDLFSLWKDEQLPPNKPLTPEILNALKHSAIVVIILSPGYMASPWCQREMQTFWQELAQRARSDSRIFVVERDKVEIDEKPRALEELLGYQFWLQDREGKAPRILGDPRPDPHDRLYYDKLNDLATDLANELLRLKKNQVTQPKATITEPDSHPTVFLAEVSDDLDAQRDRVQHHLNEEGFRVIPSETSNYFSYLGGNDDIRETLANDLKNCKLFVQLLSGYTGKCRPGLPSFPALQYEAALSAGIPVLQWRDPGLKLETIKQTEHRSLLAGGTVLAIGLEDFKQELVTRLHVLDKNPKPIVNSSLVFINTSNEDIFLAESIGTLLKKHEIGVALPLRSSDPKQTQEDMEQSLSECDGLIIIYGPTTITWARAQILRSRRIISLRDRPLKAFAVVYEGTLENNMPLGIELQNMMTINCSQGLHDSDLIPFIAALQVSENKLRTIKIFLASSSELTKDRDDFELYFLKQNVKLRERGVFLEIIRWENFLDAMSRTRLQEAYNKEIRKCDIFVSLFFTKTGKFTEEEFDTAYQHFNETGKPLIYTFFKNDNINTGNLNQQDINSLFAFKKKLSELGHYFTNYDNIKDLKLKFSDQLDILLKKDI
ncbi:MAG: toll/interleukin-1 receptor domain-containing protein [Methylococcaceae bacterium]|jgi:hypothetical protein